MRANDNEEEASDSQADRSGEQAKAEGVEGGQGGMNMIDKIWGCAQDLIGYANELESKGRSESGEAIREIVGQIEHLCDWMEEHPKK